MAKFIIDGKCKLKGNMTISGNKNAVFPCVAAALLTKDEVILKNIPKIADVGILIEILSSLGIAVKFFENTLTIKSDDINSHKLPEDLTTKLRGSVVLAGAILAKVGKVEFAHPGGDIIGKRSISAHLDGFESLGYKAQIENRTYKISKTSSTKNDAYHFLEEPSVTGTENLILAAMLRGAKVTLKNCAQEPHIVDLCHMLVQMGAKIEGIGSATLTLESPKELNGTEFSMGPDFIEMGTYAVAAVLTGGTIKMQNCSLKDLEPVTRPLQKMGIKLKESDGAVMASAEKVQSIDVLKTNIWPGFPTDLMSIFIVLATQARGVSLLHDWMYESRMFFVDKLIAMGANITIADPHRVLVYGPSKLIGREVESPDIRAGMALVLAALVADGQSVIHRAELIERGYANVAETLTGLGACIQRID